MIIIVQQLSDEWIYRNKKYRALESGDKIKVIYVGEKHHNGLSAGHQ